MRSSNSFLFIAAGVAAAALFYFGTGLHPIWPLLWLAPIPLLAIVPRIGRGAAFLLAAVSWLVGELNLWAYFTRVIQVPLPVIAFAFVIPAIAFGFGILITRTFIRRESLFLAALAFPAYWVAYEYLTEVGSPHSTFGNLGYTQMNCLPIIQIASITGVWGISFIVFLFAATIAGLLSGVGQPRQRRTLAIVTGVVLSALFLFGEWRLRLYSPAQYVHVTLLAKDVPMSAYLGSEEQALALLHEYAGQVRLVTPAGCDAVVLPEKIARISESALPEVDRLFSAVATDAHTAIVVGLVRQTSSVAFNSARLYSPDGAVTNYDKHHLLLGIEPEKPGDTRIVVDQPSGRWGLQICKDMDFPKLSREYAAEGANLLLVPAWDFNLDRWLHARMAVLRAVENGCALARSARSGLLTISDNRARIVAETASGSGRFVSVSGKVGVTHERTFYTQTGDWFAWFCVATLVVLLAWRFLGKRRHT